MAVIAHLSDTHIAHGDKRSVKRLARVARFLARLAEPVDAILVTGDIADNGRREEYEKAKELLAFDVPVLACPGNHDEREAFREVLLDETGTGPINRVHRLGNLVIAMCDSSIPDREEGHLDDETLTWLREVLDESDSDASILVALHHPPVELSSPIVDPIRLRDPQGLGDIVAGDPRIVAVLCGHAHTSAVTTFAGKPLIVAPGVSSVLGPVWEGGRDDSSVPIIDYGPGPAVAFHVVDGDRITTHFRSASKGINRYRLGHRRSR